MSWLEIRISGDSSQAAVGYELRWSTAGRGKRGGVRIIYYWLTARDTILMLFIYAKGVQDDLTRKQLKALNSIVDEEYQ